MVSSALRNVGKAPGGEYRNPPLVSFTSKGEISN